MTDPTTQTVTPDGTRSAELRRRRDALAQALDRGGERLPADDVRAARALIDKVDARTAVAGARTVVALAGATGSGKSSLFNALATEPVSRIGARRPTTSAPAAAIWGDEPSDALLDWLGVSTRHRVPAAAKDAARLDGLVLLDLPDFDSRVAEHRAEADRVLAAADVFVWVTDPQKYADAVMHDDYIRRLAGYGVVTVVVLNQTDRLARSAIADCAADLERLLTRDGVRTGPVVTTSAVRGTGVPTLLERVAEIVNSRGAAEQRLLADLSDCATALRRGVADGEATATERSDAHVVDAVSTAAGVPVLVDAVVRDYREQAARRTGWPPLRRLSGLGSAPVRRDRLERVVGSSLSRKDTRMALGGSSLRTAAPAARAAVDVATRRFGDEASAGLPAPWADSVHDAAAGEHVYDALDQQVASTDVQDRDPRWWTAVWATQWALVAVALAGLVWLLVLAGVAIAGGSTSAPGWGPLPVPAWMLIGGVVLGILLALLSRWCAARGARRRALVARRRLGRAVSAAVGSQVVTPVDQVLRDHAATREDLDDAAGGEPS